MGNRKGLKQLSIYISEELHAEIKNNAKMRKITIKDYIMSLHAVSAGKSHQPQFKSKVIYVCKDCSLMFGSVIGCIDHIEQTEGENKEQHRQYLDIHRSKTKYRGKKGWDCLVNDCNTNYIEFIDIARHQQQEHALFSKFNLD